VSRDPLSSPRGTPGSPRYSPDVFGRLAEKLARQLGTGRYLAAQTVLVVLWIAANAIAGAKGLWDKYPFILLNLAFSTQAAYAAPLILLAQNRQADREKAEAEWDRQTSKRYLAETEYLAREINAIRITLEGKASRDEIIEPLKRMTLVLEGNERADG
jgi:uncharacterized membrane protein